MRALLLRTTTARWLAPSGTLAATAALLLDAGWEGSWGDTTLHATTHLLLLLPLVMFAGSLDSRRLLRRTAHPSANVAARSPVSVVGQLTAAVSTWGVGGYLLVLLVGYGVTAKINPLWPPPLPWVWIVAAVGAIVAHAAVGVLLGRVVPALVALALSGLIGLVGNAVLAAEQGSIAALFSVADASFLGGMAVPRPAVQLLQVGFFLLLASAAVLGTALLVRRTRWVAASMLALVVATTGVAGGLAATGGQKIRMLVDAQGPRVCTPNQVVCLWPDHGFLARGYAELGKRMLADAPPPLSTTGWTETGLARTTGHAELYLAGNRPTAETMASSLADGLLERVAPGLDAEDADLGAAQSWLVARALEGAPRDAVMRHHKELVGLLSEPSRAQWAWFFRTVDSEKR